MSSLAYGALTKKRVEQPAGDSSAAGGNPGMGSYLDALAALVPAEVLALHAVIVSVVSTNAKGTGTVITDVPTLRVSFWLLTALSAGLFVLGRKSLKGLDLLRALIPPAAFVAWTMLQKTTAFDAVAPHLAGTVRTTIALFAAVVLGGLAAQLGNAADQAPPPPPDDGAGSQTVPEAVPVAAAAGTDPTVDHSYSVSVAAGSGTGLAAPITVDGDAVRSPGSDLPGLGQHSSQPDPSFSDHLVPPGEGGRVGIDL